MEVTHMFEMRCENEIVEQAVEMRTLLFDLIDIVLK